ncbi:MAG: CtsR family transcriptional regulator [Selenomonadales bacterium]|nr:CtsR family transcriptional regulator [Selenomonadales bacterium]
MSSNIADLIEEYILRQLAEQQNGRVELRRTDIANEISCAPSQISYVLNTRFTQDKGFAVESRRGLGGFIRIVRVPMKDIIYQDMLDQINADTEFADIKSMVRYLIKHQMISSREGALVLQAANSAYLGMAAPERVNMLKALFVTLAEFS